jgi:hypothetical protein
VAHPTVLDTLNQDHFEAGFSMLDRIVRAAYIGLKEAPTGI